MYVCMYIDMHTRIYIYREREESEREIEAHDIVALILEVHANVKIKWETTKSGIILPARLKNAPKR